ncbi:adenosylhomocysteine nucleosidase [Halobacillus karajensis]|uniref:5'-nucleotidase n=1 Tax=Halobacillus karajensis TaxID=195088 RepID=A0A024P9R5_9BACI|nr:HAD hydrolase-like protein [Halobacillus karajensis]CDQ20182.1 5'-nucleotidase [Halobacillus karajensis]CDQ25157.1 5'-nucleotidase [Halobacillus karajensis]CDQ28482.1 5'-nucleotidase [Halobacillus karajensis]SEI01698.1 adenosylhomocysteine nucleosidase [Halobacillus karajensis]
MSQSLIFDMDGTLFQTERILEISLEDTFEHLRTQGQWKGETPLQTYREIMGVPLPTVWETLLPDHPPNWRKEADNYFLGKLVANIKIGKGALYPGVQDVFEYLKQEGYSIYIASNGLTEYLQAIVDHYQLDRWVTETFSIQQIDSFDKADLVQTVKEKYTFHHGAVIGDRRSDINAANKNHFISIGCRFDFAQEEELAEADYVIDDFFELKTLLPDIKHEPSSSPIHK